MSLQLPRQPVMHDILYSLERQDGKRRTAENHLVADA